MPMNLLASCKQAPIEAIDRDEVLLASTHEGLTTCSSCVKTWCLIARFSTIASITKLAWLWSLSWVENWRFSRISCPESAENFPFSTSFSILFLICCSARNSCSGLVSLSTTRCPLWAATCAMPAPIVPAPITPIISFILVSFKFRVSFFEKGTHAFFEVIGLSGFALQDFFNFQLVF